MYRCNEIYWFSDKLNNSLDGNISERAVFKTINIYVNEIQVFHRQQLAFFDVSYKGNCSTKTCLNKDRIIVSQSRTIELLAYIDIFYFDSHHLFDWVVTKARNRLTWTQCIQSGPSM